MKTIALSLFILASAPALALDRLPLDQLKPGKWEVERTIKKPGEAPTIRKTDYCASPKKEIQRALSIASFLCKSEIKQVSEKTFDITATCNLPGGLAGTNHTTITLHDATHYTIETESKGTKFGGVPAERSESIKAVRTGECDDKPKPIEEPNKS
jgi:hypothetical protein